MFDFLKTKSFHKIFSMLLGIFVILVLRPMCKGEECVDTKEPDLKEIHKSTYQAGSKCYTFTAESYTVPPNSS
jgi:hypothetical protein